MGKRYRRYFIREYKYQLELVQVSVQEYEIEQTGEKKYSANLIIRIFIINLQVS